MFKINTLKKFASNRFDLQSSKFIESLNEISVVFSDSPEVLNKLERLHQIVTTRRRNKNPDDAIIKLYKSMCDETGINYGSFNDSFFLQPFNHKKNVTLE